MTSEIPLLLQILELWSSHLFIFFIFFKEVSLTQHWDTYLHVPLSDVPDWTIYKKMLAKIFLLKDMWRHREPKVSWKKLDTRNLSLSDLIIVFQTKRLFCDSFVLSVKVRDYQQFSEEKIIFCRWTHGTADRKAHFVWFLSANHEC